MVSLVDIVPQKKTVRIAAGDLELRGLGLRQIADLFLQFPNLRNIFVEGAPEITAAELIVQAPDAIASIIAEAAGQPEAADALAGGGGLAPDELLDCLVAIRDLTFPRGVAPFLDKLTVLVGGAGAGPSGKAPDMSVPPRLNSSSPVDTTPAP